MFLSAFRLSLLAFFVDVRGVSATTARSPDTQIFVDKSSTALLMSPRNTWCSTHNGGTFPLPINRLVRIRQGEALIIRTLIWIERRRTAEGIRPLLLLVSRVVNPLLSTDIPAVAPHDRLSTGTHAKNATAA